MYNIENLILTIKKFKSSCNCILQCNLISYFLMHTFVGKTYLHLWPYIRYYKKKWCSYPCWNCHHWRDLDALCVYKNPFSWNVLFCVIIIFMWNSCKYQIKLLLKPIQTIHYNFFLNSILDTKMSYFWH